MGNVQFITYILFNSRRPSLLKRRCSSPRLITQIENYYKMNYSSPLITYSKNDCTFFLTPRLMQRQLQSPTTQWTSSFSQFYQHKFRESKKNISALLCAGASISTVSDEVLVTNENELTFSCRLKSIDCV